MRPMHTKVCVIFVVPLLVSACTGSDHPTVGESSPAAAQSAAASASQICVAALHHPVSASSLTTVGAVRGFRFGPPGHPAPNGTAFAGSPPSTIAAWCTVRSPSKFGKSDTFFAAGPGGTSVRILTVSGPAGPGPGPVPNHPVQIP